MHELSSKRPRIEEESSIEKFTFNWLIEEFKESAVEIESKLFEPLSTIPVKFRLQALRGSASKYVNYEEFSYEFYLLKCSGETIPRNLRVQCEIELRCGDYNNRFRIRSETFDVSDRILLFTGYFRPESRYGAIFRVGTQRAFVENFIDMLLNFEFFNVLLNSCESTNTCLADFKSLYDSKEMCDVSINIGQDVVKAHKFVLSARSPVFKAMFTCKLVEEQTNCVKMEENIDLSSMDYFLRYLYCGDMGNNVNIDTICNIYSLANKYQVADLSKHCSSIMAVELSLDNVLQIAVLSDLYNDELKEKAFAHIHQHMQEIIQLKTWKDFSEKHPNLFKKILR